MSGIAEPASPGSVLALIRSGEASTRNELAEQLGVARSTVVQRLGVLSDAGLVRVAGDAQSSGGRPASIFAFDEDAGLVVVGDLGQTGCHLAVCDLGARPLAELTASLQIEQGPEIVLEWVKARFTELLSESRPRLERRTRRRHRPARPRRLRDRPPGEPTGDARLGRCRRAEHVHGHHRLARCWSTTTRGSWRSASTARHVANDQHMIFVKIGSGIGAGLIAYGRVLRGERGAAGDIGHIVVDPDAAEVCRCGNVGCLDAVAGGWAIARRMGDIAPTPPDVVRLAREGHPEATGQVRRSGRLVGAAVANAVNLLNPTSVVIGGKLAEADEQVFAAVREVVYRHATPVASRHLEIAITELGHMAGVIGAAHMVIDHVLEPDRVGELLERRSARTGPLSAASAAG